MARASDLAQYYANHTARLASRRKYISGHRAQIRASNIRRWKTDRAKYAAMYLEWCRANPDKVAQRNRNRRALRRGADGSFTLDEWTALVRSHGGRCAYCQRRRRLTVDHRVSLVRGGTNYIENILPACAGCNSRKKSLTEEEFRALLAA